jgi:hypothetical protein
MGCGRARMDLCTFAEIKVSRLQGRKPVKIGHLFFFPSEPV